MAAGRSNKEVAQQLFISERTVKAHLGAVFDKLGMIPVDGPQNITIELDKLTVHIDKIESHQIDSAVITLKPSEEMDENEE